MTEPIKLYLGTYPIKIRGIHIRENRWAISGYFWQRLEALTSGCPDPLTADEEIVVQTAFGGSFHELRIPRRES